MALILLIFLFLMISHRITIIDCEEKIDCGINFPITEFNDGNFSFYGEKLTFLLHFYDDILYSYKKDDEVDITANSLSATLFGNVRINRILENGTKISEDTCIGYENFFTLRGFGRINEVGELSPLRIFLIHDERTKNWDKVSNNFQRFFLRETEVCLEDYIHSKGDIKHILNRNSIYETICPSPEIPYAKPVTTEFQRIINKIADITINQIVEKFIKKTEGFVRAPNLSIGFTLFLISGRFEVANGTVGDLRTIRRNSHVIYIRVGNKGNAVLELDVGPVKVPYKNFTLHYMLTRSGENLTIEYPEGLTIKAMIQIDIETFPCNVKIQSLLIEPKGKFKLHVPSSLNIVSGPIGSVFRNEEKRILNNFAEGFRKYVHQEMEKVDCKTLSFIDYLEISLKKNLNATEFFNPPVEEPPIKHD